MTSFGQQLRLYRRQSKDPKRGGMLTQERLGELIGQVMGDAGYSGAAISDWEREKSKIHADDRHVLVALLTVLVASGGMDERADADDLLATGNYRRLDEAETAAVFGERAGGVETQVDGGAVVDAAKEADQRLHLANRDRAQQVLLEKVEHFWVDGVLRKSMSDAPALTLSWCLVDDAVDHPWEMSLGPALIREDCPAGEGVADLFERSERALLILGAPGSGKTMTLISLASELLERAKADARAQIPVLLDLAGWAKERRDIASWIVEELTAKYQIPRRYGRRWVAEDELILLLDGFDVLPPLARLPAIKALNQFRITNGLCGTAICSRSQEYLNCKTKLNLNRAVRIEPLDRRQIEAYLSGSDRAALHRAVHDVEAVFQMAQSPLMLSVLAAVSEEKGAETGPRSGTEYVGPRDSDGQVTYSQIDYAAVFGAYTRQMFRLRPSAAPYEPVQTLRYLRWLAERLEEHSHSIFMIEGIQPSWLPSKGWRWVYMLLSGLLLGAAGGAIMWLLWRLLRHTLPALPAAVSTQIAGWFNLAREPVELLTILLGNLALGLLVGMIMALFFEARRRKAVEARNIARQRWLQVWTVGLVCGTTTVLFVSLFTGWRLSMAWGVAEGFMYMAAARFIYGWSYENDVRTVEALGWYWQRSLTGAIVGVILTVIAEILESSLYGYNGFWRTLVTLVMAGFILGGLTGSRTSRTSYPNQGVWLSLRNAGYAAVIVTVPLAVLTTLIRQDPIYGLLTGLLTAAIAAALFGVGVFIKHFLLRGLLRIQHSLPWRYSRFLDHAAQLVFLRKVGGGYIFMHRLLQQYFAGLDPMDQGS